MRKLIRKIKALFHLLAFKLGWTQKPIALRWNITSGCPKRCHYCNNEKISRTEPSVDEINTILKNILDSKPSRISISGGEPLTSPHFEYIVDQLSSAGVSVIMNTSGIGMFKKKEAIRKMDLVQLSLDGPEELCDKARGVGTYKKVMEAIDICKALGTKFSFATTMSRENTSIETVDFMLELAQKYKTVVAFQPVKRVWGLEYDFDNTAPKPEQMRQVVKHLIDLKKAGNKHIRNSRIGLEHIKDWPNYPDLHCTGGKMFAVIQADGNLVACDRIDTPLTNNLNLKNDKLIPSLKQMAEPQCAGCGFCGATELNYLNKLDFSMLPELSKL